MIKEFFEKYSRNPVAQKDKEVLSQLVNEGNGYLSKLKNIDSKILYIQKSTKTTFSFFSPVHNYCRTKYTWYYNWSAKPYATKVHAGVLSLALLVSLGVASSSILGFPNTGKANIDFAPETAEKNIDYSTIYKSVKPDATEVVAKRTENQKVFQNPDGTQQYIISGGPLHYKDASNNFKNIDSSIVAKEDNSGFAMDKSIYSANFNKEFTADPLVQISKDDQNLSVKPGELSLINATENQKISDPIISSGEGNGHQIIYKNAYGPGLDFAYETQDLQLNKKLNISTLESLPTPTIDMTSETDANLKLNLEFGINAGLELFIDDQPWDGTQTTIENQNLIFKKEGKTLWQLTPPKAWDSSSAVPTSSGHPELVSGSPSPPIITGKATISKTGDKIDMSVLFPYSWLKTAQYPVTIDPDTYYGATTDGHINGSSIVSYSAAHATSTGYDTTSDNFSVGQIGSTRSTINVFRAYLEFDTSGIDDAATVSQANLYLTPINDFSTTNFTVRIHKYNWTSPLAAGTREADYDGALASTFDANWKNTADGNFAINTSFGSANLDPTWIQKGATLTQYALLSDRDVAATTPTGPESVSIASQENATEAYRPYLSITVAAGPNSCQSAATGNWSDASSWTACGGTTPQAGDSATILDTHTITLTAPAAITNVTINSGGTLNSNSQNFTVSGNFSIVSGGTFTKGGTLTFSGTTTYTDSTATPQNIGTVVINGTSATLASSMTVDSMTVTSGTLNLASAGYTLKLSGTGTPLSVTGSLTPGTNSIVQYVGTTTATTVATVPYHDLKFTPTGATAYNMTGSLTGGNAMTGDLTIDANATVNTYVGTTSYDIRCVNLTINSGGTLYSGTDGSDIIYRNSATTYNASGNSLVIDKPTGTVDGDVMLALIYINGPGYTITPPDGWSLIDSSNSPMSGKVSLYYKVASSEGPNYTWGFSATTRLNGSISSFSGVDIATPINAHGVNGNASGNSIAPSITTTVANAMLVFLTGQDNPSAVTYTPPTGMTERLDTGTAAGQEHATVLQAAAGATGTKTAVPSSPIENASFLVALKPSSNAINVAGDFTNAGTFTAGNSTVNFTKATGTQTLDSGGTGAGKAFSDIVHSGAGTLQLLTNDVKATSAFFNSGGTFTTLDGANSRNVTVDGDFTINNSSTVTANNSTFTVGGSWDHSAGTFTYGTSTVTLTGTSTVNTSGDAKPFYNFTAAASTKTTTLSSDLNIQNVITLANGAIALGSYAIRMYKSNGDPLSLTGTTATGDTSGSGFLYRPSANISVAGITTGTTIYYSGITNDVTITLTSDVSCGRLQINEQSGASGKTTTLDTANHAITTSGNLYIGYDTGAARAGQLLAGSSTINVTGDMIIWGSDGGNTNTFNGGSATINVTGNWINSDTFTAGTSTVNFTKATGTQTLNSGGTGAGNSFYNLTHYGAGTLQLLTNDLKATHNFLNSGGTFTTLNGATSRNVTVDGNFTISNSSTVTANASTFTVGGNWDQSAGTFGYGTSTANLTGTGTISTDDIQSTHFYNLTCAANTKTTTLSTSVGIGNIITLANGGTLAIGANIIYAFKSNGDPLSQNGASITGDNTNFSFGFIYRPSANISVAGITTGSTVAYSGKTNDVTITLTSGTTAGGILIAENTGSSTKTTTLNTGNFPLTTTGTGAGVGLSVGRSNSGSRGGTLLAGSSTINLAGDLGIYASDGSNANTLDAGSATFNVAGNFANSDIFTAGTSTVNFTKATGTQTLNSGGTAAANTFNNVTYSGAGTLRLLTNNINIDGNFTNSAGTFDANNLNMTVAKDFNISGGSFSPKAGGGATTQTVTFDSISAAIVSGSTTFNNLTINSATDGAKTVNFASGSTQTVNGTINLAGAVGKVLTLGRDQGTGTDVWTLTLPDNYTSGDYIAVANSAVAGDHKITPSASGHVTDNGNNPGWIFNEAPNAPTLLGPSGYVDGAWQTDSTPTLTFNLTDPDGVDQVKYEIIISTHSDFSSPTVDYTSDLGAQGDKSYTPDPALADGIYYWEVKTIDSSNISSSYSVAGESGTADIKVDTAVPTTDIYLSPTDPNGTNSYYKTTAPTVTFTADDGSGSGASTIYYRWGASGDFSAYSTGIQAPEGTNTIYYYGTDLAGNSGVGSPFSRTIKTDTVTPTVTAVASPLGPNGSNNYYTGTVPTITLSSSDATSGLLNIQYKWDSGSYATYTTPLTAAEGTHTLYYYATDNAGNTGSGSAGSTVYNVDTGIPTISVVVAPLSPNGTNSYYITTAPTITLSALDTGGSGVASIQYKWDSGSYATYSTPLTAPEGTHTLHYYSIDTANNNSAEANQVYKTDLTNPTVDIYANPATPNGDNGYYKTAPAITFTGLDNSGGSGLLNIYYHWDSNSDSTYTTGFNAPEGHRIIHYYAKDNAGNQTADTTRDYYVDTNTPTVSAVSDPVSANGQNGYFTGSAPTISLTGNDGSNSGIASIKYRWGTSGDYSTYSIPLTAPENTNTLYYYAIDNAGNSGASSPFSRTIKTDTANPSIATPSATSPTNDTTPTWSWSASSDAESGIAGYYVKIGTASGGNNALGETYLAGSDTLTYTPSSPLSDNSYYLSAKAKDRAGNIGDYTSSTALLVDATVPAITAFTINSGDSTTGSLNITLQITASDASSGLSARQFSQDGVAYSDWEACDNTSCNTEKAYTLNTGDGTKTVYLKVKDLAGNESNASSDTILLDTTGPGAFSLLSPANNSWASSTSMHLTWEGATDLTSSLAKYQLYLDDAIINDNIVSNITSYDLSNLAIGTHTWQVKAIDTLNNETLSEKRTFSIDQTAPTAPTAVAITNLSNTDLKLVKDMPIKFAWTASADSGAGVLSYLIYIGTTSGASDIVNGEETSANSYEASLQTDGTYFITVKAKDGAGNISVLSEEYSFKVDHTAPTTIAKTVSFDTSNRIAGTYSSYIAWSSSFDPSGEGIKEYVVYSGNDKIATIPFNTNGKESPRRFVQTGLKPGNYSFKVAPVDLADNLGAFSAESKLEISAEAGPALLISELAATPSTLVDPETGKTSILISWKTNALSTSVVELEGKTYGEEDLTKLNTGHSILITDLKASTTYRFIAKSRDIFGGQAESESTTVRTGAIVEKQSTLETILNSLRNIFSIFKNVSAAALETIGLIKPTQITKEGLIAFNVSDQTVGNAVVLSLVKAGQQIERSTDGKTFSSLATPSDNYYIDDQVTIDNTYYYRLSGSNGIARINIGNKEDSAPTITDPKVIEEATQVADDKVRVAIGWQTDIPSTSQLSYGIGETNLESTKDDNLNTNHFVVLEGLKSGTEYKFKAKSEGANNLTSESSEFAFVTPKTAESQSIIDIIVRQLQDAFTKFMAWMRV